MKKVCEPDIGMPKVFEFEIDKADAGMIAPAALGLKVPANSLVRFWCNRVVAFDSGTSDVLDIGAGMIGYVSALDLQTTGTNTAAEFWTGDTDVDLEYAVTSVGAAATSVRRCVGRRQATSVDVSRSRRSRRSRR